MPIEGPHIYLDKDDGSGVGAAPVPDDSDSTGVKEFEEVARPYPELGKEKHGLDVWGDIKIPDNLYFYGWPSDEIGPAGSYVNLYTSPEMIKRTFTWEIFLHECEMKAEMKAKGESPKNMVLADIGGGDGFVLNTTLDQLERNGVDVATAINIEADPNGQALPTMQTKIESGEYSPKLQAIRANILTEVPLEPESVDFVISRCAIQYSTKEQHIQFLKNIAEMLREGGKLVLQFPGAPIDQEVAYTEIQREISKIVTGGVEFQRDFPDASIVSRFKVGGIYYRSDLQDYSIVSKLVKDIDLLEEVGLFADEHDEIEWLISPESWGDRFNLNKEKIEEIRQLYTQIQQKYPSLFKESEGKLCLRTSLVRGTFHKLTKREREDNIRTKKQIESMQNSGILTHSEWT